MCIQFKRHFLVLLGSGRSFAAFRLQLADGIIQGQCLGRSRFWNSSFCTQLSDFANGTNLVREHAKQKRRCQRKAPTLRSLCVILTGSPKKSSCQHWIKGGVKKVARVSAVGTSVPPLAVGSWEDLQQLCARDWLLAESTSLELRRVRCETGIPNLWKG